MLLTVVEAGSFSAAARRLNTSLPTISRKVAELEHRLGSQLLIRTARRVELTEAGDAYVAACRVILEQIEQAERAAAGEYSAPTGELTITAPVMFGRRHVLPVAAEFLEHHPAIKLRVYLADKNIPLVEEHVHVAVRIGELADTSLRATRVGSVRRVVCASPDYLSKRGTPTSLEDLQRHDAITIGGFAETLIWQFVRDEGSVSAEVRSKVDVNMTEGALDAALAGLGITRLLSYQVADAVASGALVPVLEEFAPPPIPINLVYLDQKRLPLKVRAFLNWSAPRLRSRLSA